MKVKVIGKTVITDPELIAQLKSHSAEELIMYCARVSNPNNQTSGNPKLLSYCAENAHWSVFEMSDMVVELETSRMIAPQILRHWSFSFQEFSQRYAAVDQSGLEIYAIRRQDKKNRQNSIDDMSDEYKKEFEQDQHDNWKRAFEYYIKWLDRDGAKEVCRTFLPLGAKTKMYMKGSVRDWIHYINLRADVATQKEHRDIAEAIKAQFVKEFPVVAEALKWK